MTAFARCDAVDAVSVLVLGRARGVVRTPSSLDRSRWPNLASDEATPEEILRAVLLVVRSGGAGREDRTFRPGLAATVFVTGRSAFVETCLVEGGIDARTGLLRGSSGTGGGGGGGRSTEESSLSQSDSASCSTIGSLSSRHVSDGSCARSCADSPVVDRRKLCDFPLQDADELIDGRQLSRQPQSYTNSHDTNFVAGSASTSAPPYSTLLAAKTDRVHPSGVMSSRPCCRASRRRRSGW